MNSGRGKRRSRSRGKAAEEAWDLVIEKLDSRVLRRAKVAAKQGEIGDITVQDGRICAAVRRRGPDRRSGKVSLPLVDSWAPYRRSVATWFCQRPDWLASLMAGHWDDEFLGFVASTGLSLFPIPESLEEWLAEAQCGCDDWETPCRHVVALIAQMAAEVSAVPLSALTYVGLSVEDLLDEAHRMTAERMQVEAVVFHEVGPSVDTREMADSAAVWIEELTVLSGFPSGGDSTQGPSEATFSGTGPIKVNASVMAPTIDGRRLAELTSRYLRLT